MAQVPYKPVPDVPPSQQGIQNIDIPTPGAAFGTTIAEAIGSFGKQLERSSDEIFARAIAMGQVENQARVSEVEAQYEIAVGERRAEYGALQGDAAVQGYKPFAEGLEKLRQEHRAMLPNKDAQRRFDIVSRGTMSRSVFSGAGHRSTEHRQYAISASDGRVAAATNMVLVDPTEANYEHALRVIETETRGTGAAVHGWSPEETENQVIKRKSLVVMERINGLVKRDPEAAKDFYEKNKSLIFGTDQDKVQNTVRQGLHQLLSRKLSDMVNPTPEEGVPQTPLAQRIETARAEARRIAPDDPLLPRTVENQVPLDFNHGNAVLRNDRQNREQAILGVINGIQGPVTLEQVLADPMASGAWDNMRERERNTFRNMIASKNAGLTRVTLAGGQRFLLLRGMATDEAKQAEFMDIKLTEEYGQGMSLSQITQLMKMQKDLQTQRPINPVVTRGMALLSNGILKDLKLTRKDNEDEYLKFKGAFQEAIVQEQKNRPPNKPFTDEDIYRIGGTLLREVGGRAPGNEGFFPDMNRLKIFFLGSGATKVYNREVPDADIEWFRNDQALKGRTVNEVDIADFKRVWRQRQYQQLYEGGAKK